MRSTHRWHDDDPGDAAPDGVGGGPDEVRDGYGGAEPVPLIELTGDDLDDEGTVDQLAEYEPERRRGRRPSRPRRYLVGAALGLVAIGFAGGILVQRASAPPPADDAATVASSTQVPVRAPEFDPPSADAATCRYIDGYGAVGITTVCTGTLYTIRPAGHGWLLTLSLDQGATIGVEADGTTSVDGVGSVGEISVGAVLVISGHTGADGTMHASVITFAGGEP